MRDILFLCLLGAAAAVDNKIDEPIANEYCDICEDHTLCKYEGIGKACEGSDDSGVSTEEQKYILDTHNWYRRVVAKGLETRGLNGTQPSASNMLKMEWDDELATIAQRWADQCQFQHDTCRQNSRFKIGQNIYWNWRFPVLKTVNWTAAIASWYDEVDKFDPELVHGYEFNPSTGHFTQLVWHDSSLIGCGRRSYGPNKIYVCNYGPAGNWLNEPMYHAGEPCALCPHGTTCEDGLCAEIPPAIDPSSYEPIDEGSGAADFTKILNPPTIDAVNEYNSTEVEETGDTEVEIAAVTTELPIHLNLIDDLNIPDDEEIRNEIEDLKQRIRKLVEKIAAAKLHKLDQ